jgi:uncharacterized protein YfeS
LAGGVPALYQTLTDKEWVAMSDEKTDDEIAAEAMTIANEMQLVLANRIAVAGLAALGMILGYYDSMRNQSDMDSLMAVVRHTATAEAKRIRAERLH